MWSLDIPHGCANLDGSAITRLDVTKGKEWLSLSWHARRSGLRGWCTTLLLKLLATTRTLRSCNVLVATSTVGCQVSIVDGRNCNASEDNICNRNQVRLTHGDRSGRSHVLIAVLVNQLLQIVDRNICLIHQDLVVHRASSALNSGVR